MNIKNIRDFRRFFKEEIIQDSNSNRDENFVGVKHKLGIENGRSKNVYGFFSLYHGDKDKQGVEGIRGFLEGFLDMAKDAQAVYEFMQNAVDANSTHFAMFWIKDDVKDGSYLLVFNNGKMFDMPAVRSILNVGVSTKKPEEHTIGKFGIGFKLAHRLVGKDNGLDELIYKNYGPTLFSWKNNEIFNFPKEINQVVPTKQSYEIKIANGEDVPTCDTTEPWLFKILITNFPVQPNDEIKDVHFKPTKDAFTAGEFAKMAELIEKYSPALKDYNYKEGSCFFIKLGQGKLSHLNDDDLKVGVKFSTAILNHITNVSNNQNAVGLQKVQLNENVIDVSELDNLMEYLDFEVKKNTDDYAYIRFGKYLKELSDSEKQMMEKDDDIKYLMGFTDFQNAEKIFKNAPNFYLFFPLSEEKHKIKFIIHCNAFYKASHRTSLHTGQEDSIGINERLFQKFTELLIKKLEKFRVSTNEDERQFFLKVYSSLLLSDPSDDNQNRKWINKPLVNPLLEYIKKYIPTKAADSFKIETLKENVKIKDTSLSFSLKAWGIDLDWFYWNDKNLGDKAISKLGINKFTIADILMYENIADKINQLIEKDDSLRIKIIGEVNQYSYSIKTAKQTKQRENLFKLKLFSTTDNKLISVEELGNQGMENNIVFLFSNIKGLKNDLLEVGFATINEDLTLYPSFEKMIQDSKLIRYFSNSNELNKILNPKFRNNNFSPKRKYEILKIIENAFDNRTKEDRIQRVKTLELFKNKNGQVMPLSALLKDTQDEWLKSFIINPVESNENSSKLEDYIITSHRNYYQNLIEPYWDLIIEKINKNPSNFYQKVSEYFKFQFQAKSLSNKRIVLTHKGFLTTNDNYYFHPNLAKISEEKYPQLAESLEQNFNILIPLQNTLDYLQEEPFGVSISDSNSIKIIDDKENLHISKEVAELIIEFAKCCDWRVLDNYIFTNLNEQIIFRRKKIAEKQVWINDDKLQSFISKNHSDRYFHCVNLKKLKDLKPENEKDVIFELLEEYSLNNQLSQLNDLLIDKGDSLISKYFELTSFLDINLDTWENYKELRERVKIILSLTNRESIKNSLNSKIILSDSVIKNVKLIDLSGLGVDTIYFGKNNEYEIKLSDMFPNSNNQSALVNKLVTRLEKDLDVKVSQLRKLFDISEEVDKEKILNKFEYNDDELVSKVNNAAQFAYLLLYNKEQDNDAFKEEYYIKSIVGWDSVSEVTLINHLNINFCNDNSKLLFDYEKVSKYLKLSVKNPIFEINDYKLFYQPYLKNGILITPSFIKPKNESEKISLLNFLLNIYDNEETVKIENNEYYNISYYEWSDILGFEPTNKLLGEYKYQKNENLPIWLTDWLNNESNLTDKKLLLLQAIGVNSHLSPISLLRKKLVQNSLLEDYDIKLIQKIDLELLKNTLKLLYENDFSFKKGTVRYKVIKKIIQTIAEDIEMGVPLPIYNDKTDSYKLYQFQESDFYWHSEVIPKMKDYDITYEMISAKIFDEFKIFNGKEWGEYGCLYDNLRKIEECSKVINNTQKIASKAKEWSKVFYDNWRKEYPDYNVYLTPNFDKDFYLEDYLINSKTSTDIEYVEDEEKKNIFIYESFDDEKIIEVLSEISWIQSDALNLLRKLHEQFIETINTFLQTNQGKISDKLQELQDEIIATQKRQSLRDNLEESGEYSYSWFINFLELLTIQNDNAADRLPERDIFFSKVLRDDTSQKIFELRDPNRTITPTIEFCDNFHAAFIDINGQKESIKIQGVSKKGQKLWAVVSNANELDKIDFNKIKRVELTFTRSIDLLERLHSAFVRLGEEEGWYEEDWHDEQLDEILTDNIEFIFGPPGTGKTTTIARQILDMMSDGEDDKRIVLLTPTNKAADVLIEKIVEIGDKENLEYKDWLVRYGASFSSVVEEKELLYDANTFALDNFPSCVLVTTIHRYPYEEVTESPIEGNNGKEKLSFIAWDTIIFDEASMIPLPYIMFSILQSQTINDEISVIIGGDPFQIPPVVVISNEDIPDDFKPDENIYDLVGLHTFDEDEQKNIERYGDNITNLTTQYRSIEAIGKLFSWFRYNGVLEHGRNEGKGGSPMPRELPQKLKDLGIRPITLMRFPVNLEDSIYRPGKTKSRSPYHIYSAILVYEIIEYFNHVLDKSNEEWTIGIVCPYRTQATLVNKLIESNSISNKLNIITDTVHGFQGDQCDMVFYLMSPSNENAYISRYDRLFLHKNYLTNVAISRARDYLIVLYPDDETKGISNLYRIKHPNKGSLENIIIDKLGTDINSITIHSDKIEKDIFSQKKFIEENILTHKHQLVNIYANAEKRYTVKIDMNAIDIQIQK